MKPDFHKNMVAVSELLWGRQLLESVALGIEAYP
jgi:hypothetical protein